MAKKERATAPTVAHRKTTIKEEYSFWPPLSNHNSVQLKNTSELNLDELILGLAIILEDGSLNPSEMALCRVIVHNMVCRMVNRSRGL